MTKELDRLMTINDLSEMLGVPVDTLYGWRHRGEAPRAIESVATFAIAGRPSKPGLTLKPIGIRDSRWRTSSGAAFSSATPPDEPALCALQGALSRCDGKAPQRDQDQIGRCRASQGRD
jgi:hypothetical protein